MVRCAKKRRRAAQLFSGNLEKNGPLPPRAKVNVTWYWASRVRNFHEIFTPFFRYVRKIWGGSKLQTLLHPTQRGATFYFSTPYYHQQAINAQILSTRQETQRTSTRRPHRQSRLGDRTGRKRRAGESGPDGRAQPAHHHTRDTCARRENNTLSWLTGNKDSNRLTF